MIYHCAAILGLLPDDLTLRELVAMSQHRIQYDWHRTSAILATLLNCHGAGRLEIVPLNAFVPHFHHPSNPHPSDEIITDPLEKKLIAEKLRKGI